MSEIDANEIESLRYAWRNNPTVLSLIDALEKAQDSNDHYVGEFNRVMEERDSAYDERNSALAAKDAEIARLREAVLGSRPFVKLAVTQEQAEASARWHSKAMAALSAIDAALKGNGEG